MQVFLAIHAFFNLMLGLLFLLFWTWFFWPKVGGFAWLSHFQKNKQRALLEEALKYIFDCDYKNISCDPNSIAGNLHVSMDTTVQLLDKLTQLQLIQVSHQQITLTTEGWSYALRIVRNHRILERYLADETNISPTDWHDEAKRRERLFSNEDTEKLAAQMGNPMFDPHGDPIPSAHGNIPSHKGISLSLLKEGESGIINHLEDEPKSIYEQLNVLGLYPGMPIFVTEVNDTKISCIANGEKIVLTPLFAGNITIDNTLVAPPIEKPTHQLLSHLKIGETAQVVGLSPHCRGQQRRRLMDLGIIPGSTISAILNSASGDPKGYRVMGTTIGIRQKHAQLIFIKNITPYEYV